MFFNWFILLVSCVVIKVRFRKLNFFMMEMIYIYFKFKVKILIKDNIES